MAAASGFSVTFAKRNLADAIPSDPLSANGWPILHNAAEHVIEGSNYTVRLADGDAAAVLLHVVRRFHYEVDSLEEGDVQGFSLGRPVNHPMESNYLSGTAVTIRSTFYPLGVGDGLYPDQLTVIRDILAELDGAVAWGGDKAIPKESHFEIAYPPNHLKVVNAAQRIRSWGETSGGYGAGSVNAFTEERLRAAEAFRIHQHPGS